MPGRFRKPVGPNWIPREISKRRDDTRRLETSTSTVGKAGVSGKPRWYNAAGNIIQIVGDLGGGNTGTRILSAAGQKLFEAYDGAFSHIAAYDGAGRVVIADNEFYGGVARPWIPLGVWQPASQPGTLPTGATSTTWVTVALCDSHLQAPFARFDIYTSAGASTTGNARILDPNGVQIGSTVAIAANSWNRVRIGPVALNGGLGAGGLVGDFQLQVQRTAGSAAVNASGIAAWGCASYDPA